MLHQEEISVHEIKIMKEFFTVLKMSFL